MTKIGFVSSEKPDAIKSLKMMEQTYDSVPPEKADIIVYYFLNKVIRFIA